VHCAGPHPRCSFSCVVIVSVGFTQYCIVNYWCVGCNSYNIMSMGSRSAQLQVLTDL